MVTAAVTDRAYTNFLQAIGNDHTLKTYKDGLATFMRFFEGHFEGDASSVKIQVTNAKCVTGPAPTFAY